MRHCLHRAALALTLLLCVPHLHARTPPAPVGPVVALAQADVAAKRFEDAVALLQAQPAPGPTLRHALADAQSAWARDLLDSSHFAEAIPHFQAAFILDKGDRLDQSAHDLRRQAAADLGLSQYATAVALFQQALSLYRQAGDREGEAKDLIGLGTADKALSQYSQEIQCFQQALVLLPQTHGLGEQAPILHDVGDAFCALHQYARAVPYYQQALAIARKAGDMDGEVDGLNTLGGAYNSLSRYQKAIDCYQLALPLLRRAGDKDGEASGLNNIGNAYRSLSRYGAAISYFQQALALHRQAGDTHAVATTLGNLSSAYEDLSDYPKAIACIQQALPLLRQAGDKDAEAGSLGNLGSAYKGLSQYPQAIALYQQSLALFSQAGDKDGEAGDLNNLGNAYNSLSQYAQALDYYGQALKLHHLLGDQDGEAGDLNDTGDAYLGLSQYQRAIDLYGKALSIQQQTGDRDGEAGDLTNLGNAYLGLSQYQRAIDFYGQALPIYRQTGHREGEAGALNNLGAAYQRLNQYARATSCYTQSLSIQRQTGNKDGEASDLGNLGITEKLLGRYDQAVACYGQALPLYRQAGDRDGEAGDLNNLMLAWQAQHAPKLAIFYGKQSVNTFQSIRGDIQTFDQKTQRGYLASVSGTYRTLADLLIGQGRLPEAEQVLGMLKAQEEAAFVNRDAALAPAALLVSFDPDEQAAQAHYQAFADPVTKIGQQIEALRALRGRTPAQDQQLVALQDQLSPASARFQAFLAALPREMPADAAPDKRRNEQLIQDAQGPLQRTLGKMGPGTVALFTLVEPDRFRVIVVTSQTEKAEDYPIPADKLRLLVFAWRAALQDPDTDPNVLGQKLSKILIGPIEADLVGAQATTLLWSLDDVLRYVPVAALYDGKHYLVEKYRSALFAGATLPGLSETAADWQGGDVLLALGVTQAQQVPDPAGGASLNFPALPGVDQELKGIARYTGNPGGVLAGTPLEDARFTQASLRGALAHGYPVVHIASHFALGANDRASYLLLGDGTVLSLADLFGQGGQIFQGVDLLTLSACQTGVSGGSGDGHEVESLASVAQEQGAGSILASLWPVSDATTPLLMRAFYRQLSGTPAVTKAGALRQAQLSLLRGTASPAGDAPTRGTQAVPAPGEAAGAPTFTPDPRAPYAHPYYWAPFVLIGNGR